MKIFLLVAINLFYLSDTMATEDLTKWSAQCALGKVKVIFEAKSKSGEPYEDDMTAQIQIGKNKSLVPVGSGVFKRVELKNQIGICDKSVGIPLNSHQFLLLFAVDERPTLDALAALLVDTESKVILDLNKNLGNFLRNQENQIQIEKTETGFRALMAQGWNKSAKSDSVKEIATGWVDVKVKNGKISAAWEKPLPPTHSPYGNSNVAPAH